MHPREQAAQRPVVGLVQPLDAPQRVVDRDALVVDFLRVTDHARDRAEPAGDPHRARVGERGQAAVEHARIELVGLAVHVHIAAREMHPHERVPARHDSGDQVVDEGVLRAAQRREIELGGVEKGPGIDAPAVGGVEHDRPSGIHRLEDFERGIEFGLRGAAHRDRGYLCRCVAVRTFPCGRGSAKIRPGVHRIFTRRAAYGWLNSQDPPPFP